MSAASKQTPMLQLLPPDLHGTRSEVRLIGLLPEHQTTLPMTANLLVALLQETNAMFVTVTDAESSDGCDSGGSSVEVGTDVQPGD